MAPGSPFESEDYTVLQSPPPAMNTKLCCKKGIYRKNKKLLRKGIYCLVKTLILAHIEIKVGNVSSKTNFYTFLLISSRHCLFKIVLPIFNTFMVQFYSTQLGFNGILKMINLLDLTHFEIL